MAPGKTACPNMCETKVKEGWTRMFTDNIVLSISFGDSDGGQPALILHGIASVLR